MDIHVRYNQKELLLEEISKYVEDRQARSLLDIGAGDGALAIPLSKKVEHYLAIEPRPERAEALRAAGLRVIEAVFPCEVPGEYDLVVASHSLPEDPGHWQPFLQAAWLLVRPGGMLLVATFKGVRDASYDLHRELGFISSVEDADRKELEKIMASFGSLERRFPVSVMEAENLNDMTDAVSLSTGGTDEEKKEYRPKLEKILEERYKKGDTYFFPTEHMLLAVSRPAQ
jgi:SAM-dependent methyltransferase